MLESNPEWNKKFDINFSPLLKEKQPLIPKKCVKSIYVKFNCVSNGKNIIFYFWKSIEKYLIKDLFFDF
jgi:hypothetical protein